METQKLSGPITLIKKSFEIFFEKENLTLFLKIYCILIPFRLFSLYQNYFISSQSKILNTGDPNVVMTKFPIFLAAVVIFNILLIVATLLVEISGIKAVLEILGNGSREVKEVVAYGWKNLWMFFLLSLVIFLILLGGYILIVIPGIIFTIWFYFSGTFFVDKGLGVKASLSKSRELIKGKFWQVFGRAIIFGIFSILVGAIISAIPYIGSVVSSLFGALFLIPCVLLYKELLSIKESSVTEVSA